MEPSKTNGDMTKKKKKPPACDRCKAKRVLCHPGLLGAGCPRCVEGGHQCTTTPVQRRKPQKRSAPTAGSGLVPAPKVGKDESTAQADPLPIPQPLASTSQQSQHLPMIQPPSAALFSLDTAATSSLILHPTSFSVQSSSVVVTPGLARHLFYSFEQSSFFDHTIFHNISVKQIFESCQWQIDSLLPQQRVLAYSVCALGSLLSFDPAIIGTAEPRPKSFAEIDALPLDQRDLREYGRRRRPAVNQLKEIARRLGREADVTTEVSLENAASCLLLDGLVDPDTGDGESRKSRPFLGAFYSHVRELADVGGLGEGPIASSLWAIHCSSDVASELESGRLTCSHADQLALAGATTTDARQLDRELKETLAAGVDPNSWPEIKWIPLLYLRLARELSEKLLGTHARREPLDGTALATFLSDLEQLRSISTSFCAIVDILLAGTVVDSALFPHAQKSRIRWNRPRALQGVRNLMCFLWISLVPPLYREMQRRQQLAREEEDAAARKGETLTFAARQASDRLAMNFHHVREYIRLALVAKMENLERVPHLAVFAIFRQTQALLWCHVLLEEIENGGLTLDEKMIRVIERFSSLLKVGGWIHSTPVIDDLILRLDNHVYAFRLSQQQTSLQQTLQDPSFFPNDISPFSSNSGGDPSPTLISPSFASLVAIPSAANSPDFPIDVAGTGTGTPTTATDGTGQPSMSFSSGEADQYAMFERTLANLAAVAGGEMGDVAPDAALGMSEWNLW